MLDVLILKVHRHWQLISMVFDPWLAHFYMYKGKTGLQYHLSSIQALQATSINVNYLKKPTYLAKTTGPLCDKQLSSKTDWSLKLSPSHVSHEQVIVSSLRCRSSVLVTQVL